MPETDRKLLNLADHSVAESLFTTGIHGGIFVLATLLLLMYQTRPKSGG